MAKRLTRIYTRTGDKGQTRLGDGTQVEKDSLRVTAYGTTDELNCVVGMVLAHELPDTIRGALDEVQHQLFDLGGELCMPPHKAILDDQVTWLETVLDKLNDDLPALEDFVLPGGGHASAACHLARTVCRRAERELITLARAEEVYPESIKYLNRLSDLLFVMARVLARFEGGAEVTWQHERKPLEL